MKNFWENVKLGNISSMQYGFTASAKEKEVGPKFLRITDIVKDSINWSTVPYCKINNTNYKKYKIEDGDIVIARTGATAGYAKLIKNPPDAVFASYLIRVKFSQKCIPGFGGKLIESNIFKNFIKQNITGSAQPHANAPILKKFKFLLPPLKIQQKIASILSAYDELIENNNRRIEILEEMAETIYKEWFVHFRYPGHEKDKMVESEIGKIPEGWEVESILDSPYFNYISENCPKYEGEKEYFATANIEGINFIKKGEWVSYSKKPGRAQKIPKIYSVWFAKMKESYKVLFFTDKNKYIANKIILSSGFDGFKSKKEFFAFLFCLIKSRSFHQKRDQYCTGAVQISLTKKGLASIKIVIPSKHIILRFNEIVLPMVNQILIIQKNNNCLKKTRDLLLPKLISGKIDVSDLDIKIEEKK